MARFGIVIEGLEEVLEQNRELLKAAKTPFEKIRARVEGIMRRGIVKTIYAQKFTPLAPSTIARKKAKGLSSLILIGATMNLMRTAAAAGSAYVDGSDLVIPMDMVSVPYAAKHQFGIGVPKREFFKTDEETKDRAIRVVSEMLAEVMS